MYYGVGHLLEGADALPFSTRKKANFGFIFAEMIAEKKGRGQRCKGYRKMERIGSLLTPLFHHLEVDLSSTACVDKLECINTSYLIQCEILWDEDIYRFCDRYKTHLFCKLPQPAITRLQNIQAVSFLPDPDYLCPDPSASSSRTPARTHGST